MHRRSNPSNRVHERRSNLDANVSRHILPFRNHRWSPDTVIEKFYEDMKTEENDQVMSEDGKEGELFLCPVCFMEYEHSEKIGMACNHFLCNICYGMYLESAIKSGPDSVLAKCP